jgi:hypothetical protein
MKPEELKSLPQKQQEWLDWLRFSPLHDGAMAVAEKLALVEARLDEIDRLKASKVEQNRTILINEASQS